MGAISPLKYPIIIFAPIKATQKFEEMAILRLATLIDKKKHHKTNLLELNNYNYKS